MPRYAVTGVDMRESLTIVAVVAMMLCSASVPGGAQEESAALPGAAEAIENPLEFDEGPARVLFTKKDKKDWKKIKTEGEAEEFIELFWARRNPDPTVPFNPFKAEFDRRVAYADENFSSNTQRGALSDRGGVLILLGPPQQASLQDSQDAGMGDVDPGGFGGDQVSGGAWVWLYEPERMPAELGAAGDRLMFVFYEDRPGTNNFELDRSAQANPMSAVSQRVLAQAPEVLVLHPNLQQVPKPVSIPGARPASTDHLAWLEGATPQWSERAEVVVETGVADISGRPVWMQIELPAEAPQLDLLVGTVGGSGGEILSTFEVDAEPIVVGGNTAYHLGFPLSEGDYSLAVVGASGGQPQVAHTSNVTVPPAVDEGTWMSQMWVTTQTEIKDDATLGSPYCFGRMHIAPLQSGAEVSRQSQLTFMGFIARPGEDENGAHSVTARITLSHDGKRLGSPLDMPMEVLTLAGDLHVFVSAVNLAALPETGEYGLSFTVKDAVSDVTVERDLDITVVD